MDKLAASLVGGSGGGTGGGAAPMNRRQLQELVDNQRGQLERYQTRLRDVVRAYRGLAKEKEALEASLTALSASQRARQRSQAPSVPFNAGSEDGLSVRSDGSTETGDSGDTGASCGTDGSTTGLGEASCVGGASSSAGGGASESGTSVDRGGERTNGKEESVGSGNEENDDTRAGELEQSHLTTLTSALATVTQEKSRMEAAYQAEKRRLRQEMEDASGRAEEERARQANEARRLAEQLAEARARVLAQQQEREQEQADHGAMLRELQRLLAEERARSNSTEAALEEAKSAQASVGSEEMASHRATLSRLERELEATRAQLAQSEEQLRRAVSTEERARKQAGEEAARLGAQLQLQATQALEAEAALRARAECSEERAAGLEERIGEISAALGATARERQRDQETAARLRDSVSRLAQQNAALAAALASTSGSASLRDAEAACGGKAEEPAASSTGGFVDISSTDADGSLLGSGLALKAVGHGGAQSARHPDVASLEQELARVQALLASARGHDRATNTAMKRIGVDGDDCGGGGGSADDDDANNDADDAMQHPLTDCEKASVLGLQEAARRLRGTSTRGWGRPLSDKGEMAELGRQLAELSERNAALRSHCQELVGRHRRELDELRADGARERQRGQRERDLAEAAFRERVLALESEMHRQRDRSLALLAEREHEIRALRAAAQAAGSRAEPHVTASNRGPVEGGVHGQEVSAAGFSHEALELPAHSQAMLLHYAEQLSRREVEMAALRREKRDLERSVRALREEIATAEEKHQQEVQSLRAMLDERARERGRDGASLEYLKNVVYRYLTLGDARGRQHALNAIAAVLHFSPVERQAVALKHS
uniref:GRIP and coiled-coil domain-containing protein 1 n=1 Tax=Petromyzon marinus TaxID=7757 RepID=A0AAJ7WTV8_PETMA|nr:GRIP and coiled-coil domain-containing protein 1 [Petromyzon marinus]XP_032809990.1 GRIP and coiled-coil domain-containing protein 1 [Petromyzon marinus]XP_032809991.1 GRIP and coiled-coil domain-containing protein 1 [Petromyzon marinus]